MSGLFLDPVLLEPAATCLFLAGSLLVAGVVFAFSLDPVSMTVLHDTLLSTWQRKSWRERVSLLLKAVNIEEGILYYISQS